MARRLFVYFLGLAIIAVAVAWLADRPGRVVVDWQDYRIETSVAALVLALVALVVVLVAIVRFGRWILYGRARSIEWRLRRQQQKGEKAIARGLTALAAGDAAQAQKQAQRAENYLKNSLFVPLLQAQAARLAGDTQRAARYYRKLAHQPETDLLGLRGLLNQAMEAGDNDAALKLSARAVSLRPRTAWALNTLFDLSVASGDWPAADRAIDRSYKAKIISAEEAARRRAIIAVLEGRAKAQRGDWRAGLRAAMNAHRKCPDLIPAAILAAEAMIKSGKVRQARHFIGDAWASTPHPRLAALYRNTIEDRPATAQVEEIEAMIQSARDHEESRLALAEAAADAGLWAMAREALQPLIEAPSPRVARLMARLAAGVGDAAGERQWLGKGAAAARADPAWQCRHCGWQGDDWQAVCPRCLSFDTIAWQTPEAGPDRKIEGAAKPVAWRGFSESDLIG